MRVNQRVTILGLGRHGGGVGAARYLARRGAAVTITDLADGATLAASLAALADAPIARWRLGGHDEHDFRQCDLVVVNPAVRPGHPLLRLAQRHGARLTSEIELFLAACPAPVIGVTGSVGKSTTASMTAAALRAAGRTTWLGGNLGGSLLDVVDRIVPSDAVVLELSSFQLAHLSDDARWPATGVVTRFFPHHLDWHGELAHYRRSKQRLLAALPEGGRAVLDPNDAELATWAATTAATVVPPWPADRLPDLPLVGSHHRLNAALAAAAADVSPTAAAAGLANFAGLPHRLQHVVDVAGRRLFDDSKATSPEATLAALDSFSAPLWLLAGGCDKGSELDALAAKVARRCRGAALFGAVRERLASAIAAQRGPCAIGKHERLRDALAWCWRHSRAGDVLLLSPACASFDQYLDYAQRGAEFVALARALE